MSKVFTQKGAKHYNATHECHTKPFPEISLSLNKKVTQVYPENLNTADPTKGTQILFNPSVIYICVCFYKSMPRSEFSVFSMALLPTDFLSALTVVVLYTKSGGDVEEGLSERKNVGCGRKQLSRS